MSEAKWRNKLGLVLLLAVVSIARPPILSAADNPPGVISLAELGAGGKKQARARFKSLPPATKIRLEDGRILTKAEILAGAKNRPDASARAGSPNLAAQAQRLVESNDALQARLKVKIDADTARLFGELKQMPQPTPVPACAKPKIESIFPFSNFTPGGSVLIKGCGFGATQGQFVLSLSSGQGVPLTKIQWTPNGVAGTLPGLDNPAFKSAKTQPATLLVTGAKGSDRSGGVTYRAGRVVKPYPFDLVHTVVSDEAEENKCYDWADGPKGICSHYTSFAWGGRDEGTDTFTVNLKNGWTLDSWIFTNVGCCINRNDLPKYTGQGQSHATEQVKWFTGCNYDCSAWYYIDVFVEGEIGTTWN